MRHKRTAGGSAPEEDPEASGDPLDGPETGYLVPLEDFIDRNHPANDKYMLSVEHIQRQIMYQASLLRPKHVQIIKQLFTGASNTEVAQRMHTSPVTVGKIKNSENGKQLLNLLQYHLTMIEGPNIAQRRNMLWRIAQKEEHPDPKTAIQAVNALNKMNFDEENPNGPPQQPQQVQITINNLMPKGDLDK